MCARGVHDYSLLHLISDCIRVSLHTKYCNKRCKCNKIGVYERVIPLNIFRSINFNELKISNRILIVYFCPFFFFILWRTIKF